MTTDNEIQSGEKRPLVDISNTPIRPLKKRGFVPPRPKTAVSNTPTTTSKPIESVKSVSPVSKDISKSSLRDNDDEVVETVYYTILYCKKSTKKQKSYMDGVLAVKKKTFTLFDSQGKQVRSSFEMIRSDSLLVGNLIDIGMWTVELGERIKEDDFTSGRVFLGGTIQKTTNSISSTLNTSKGIIKKGFTLRKKGETNSIEHKIENEPISIVIPKDAYVIQNTEIIKGITIPPVYIDTFISKKMRDHQKEGCKFLYNCIYCIGKSHDGTGAILADEMGLGKTLTSISLLWLCLNHSDKRYPESMCKNGIVVCPSSLVENWKAEFIKWVGSERIYIMCMNVKGKQAKEMIDNYIYIHNKRKCVLIISYEMYRKYCEDINSIPCNLILCDEGHRLKGTSASGNSMTIDALLGIKTRRRVVITGTPIQNDLEELFSLSNFVNPGIFGNMTTFKQTFCKPIEQGRKEEASEQEKNLADMRSKELKRVTFQFILRRTVSECLTNCLPPKTTHYIFTNLSSLQKELYKGVIALQKKSLNREFVGATGQETLGYIHLLKLICCHPMICYSNIKEKQDYASLLDIYPSEYDKDSKDIKLKDSPKMNYIYILILSILSSTNELLLVLSNYTQVLDYIGLMLNSEEKKIDFIRLDGSTEIQKRQQLVNNFNNRNIKARVFMLSARAGGVGLNITGATRVLMIEPAWNPAIDLQSIARAWRLGQTKNVYVYRYFCSGSIEEVVLQRQLFKKDIADMAVDDASVTNNTFNKDEIKQIFTLKDVKCQTFDLLKKNKKEGNWLDYGSINTYQDDTLLQNTYLNNDQDINYIHSEVTESLVEESDQDKSDKEITIEKKEIEKNNDLFIDSDLENETLSIDFLKDQ